MVCPPTLEMLSKVIRLSSCSRMEIAGFLKKRKNNNNIKFVKLRVSQEGVSGIFPQSTGGAYNTLGMWIAGYWLLSQFWLVLKACKNSWACKNSCKSFRHFQANPVRFDLCRHYIEHLMTLIQ